MVVVFSFFFLWLFFVVGFNIQVLRPGFGQLGRDPFAFIRIVVARGSPPLRSQVAPGVGSGSCGFLLASLVDSGSLSNTIIVALPDDVGVGGEREQALDCFSACPCQ